MVSNLRRRRAVPALAFAATLAFGLFLAAPPAHAQWYGGWWDAYYDGYYDYYDPYDDWYGWYDYAPYGDAFPDYNPSTYYGPAPAFQSPYYGAYGVGYGPYSWYGRYGYGYYDDGLYDDDWFYDWYDDGGLYDNGLYDYYD